MREVVALALLLGLDPSYRAANDPADLWPPVPETMRAALAQPSVVVTRGDHLCMRFWFASRIAPTPPSAPDASPLLRQRINYPFAQGSLVGVLALLEPWVDARGQRITVGVYALRYVAQPLMKEHVGASEFRDTLLLLPPEDSAPISTGDLGPLILASERVFGTGHPAVIALYPADSEGPRRESSNGAAFSCSKSALRAPRSPWECDSCSETAGDTGEDL
jgi:hypothetical protein